MAPEIKITQKLDNNFVQVEITSKNVPKRFFKVPEAKVDEFCSAYKKQQKKLNFWTPVGTIIPLLFASAGANHLAKGLGKAGQWIAAIGAAFATGIGVMHMNAKIIMKNEEKLLQKHNAQEIIQEKKTLDFLKKSK